MVDENAPTDAGAQQQFPNAELGIGLIDVLMRGLETARQNAERRQDTEPDAEPKDFCLFAYADRGGTFCPVGYYHVPQQ